jgi:hypothetical protein
MTVPDDNSAEGEPVPAAANGLRRYVGYKPDGRRISYYRRTGPTDASAPAQSSDTDE